MLNWALAFYRALVAGVLGFTGIVRCSSRYCGNSVLRIRGFFRHRACHGAQPTASLIDIRATE